MSRVTEVIYQKPDGSSAKGYIIDEKTYEDPHGKKRVEVGSTVPTAGGVFTLTGNGGVKTPQSAGDDLKRAYDESLKSLKESNDAKLAGITAATNKKISNLNSTRGNADKNLIEANKEAYGAYIRASNPYGSEAERAARLGLSNSGYAESSRLRLADTYQKNVNSNKLARDSYLNEIDKAIAEARYDGDIARANALSEYGELVYKHGIEAADKILEQQNRAYQYGMESNRDAWDKRSFEEELNYKRERDKNELAYKREHDAGTAFERALSLAKLGFSNQQIANALGVSLAELNRIIAMR